MYETKINKTCSFVLGHGILHVGDAKKCHISILGSDFVKLSVSLRNNGTCSREKRVQSLSYRLKGNV